MGRRDRTKRTRTAVVWALVACIALALLLTGLRMSGWPGSEAPDGPDPTLPRAQEAVSSQSEPLTRNEREAALNDIRLKRIAAAQQERALRERMQRERQALERSGGKCIDGRLFRKEGNAWVDVGNC